MIKLEITVPYVARVHYTKDDFFKYIIRELRDIGADFDENNIMLSGKLSSSIDYETKEITYTWSDNE